MSVLLTRLVLSAGTAVTVLSIFLDDIWMTVVGVCLMLAGVLMWFADRQ